MNKLSITNNKIARAAAMVLTICAGLLIVSALGAESSNKSPAPDSTKKQWPEKKEYRSIVKQGFTNTLNRSAKEEKFRARLLDFTKQQDVKDAIQEEFKTVAGAEKVLPIPSEIVIIFYEVQNQNKKVKVKPLIAKAFTEGGDENRNYHVFYLPEPGDMTNHLYDDHIRCCYNPW
jgi:hypothetical protein